MRDGKGEVGKERGRKQRGWKIEGKEKTKGRG
jgi:hypothetical protein